MFDWIGTGWFWGTVALVLFAVEAMVPGAFMLWFGIAAAATAALTLLLPLSLPVQCIVFSVLALVSVGFGYRHRLRNPPRSSEQPLLNERVRQFTGEVHLLDRPIVNGRGRIRIGDAYWTVLGDEAPAGAPVRVVGGDGMSLLVTVVRPHGDAAVDATVTAAPALRASAPRDLASE